MKKLMIIAFAVALLAACTSKSLTDVTEGTPASEVLDIAGEPTEKMSMPLDIEWWIYEEEKVLLIMENDTVSRVTSQKEIEESLKDFEKGMEDIEKEIEDLTN